LSTGRYLVRLGTGITTYGSVVLVSAYGSDASHCKLESWGSTPDGMATDVYVLCFSSAGAPVDSMFTLHLGS
jgi:hypothetical protein